MPTPSPTPVPRDVTIRNNRFDPVDLTVHVGKTVVWYDAGSRHPVTSDTGEFNSGNVFAGDTYSHTFNSAGTYAYHCAVHASMTGTIEVAP